MLSEEESFKKWIEREEEEFMSHWFWREIGMQPDEFLEKVRKQNEKSIHDPVFAEACRQNREEIERHVLGRDHSKLIFREAAHFAERRRGYQIW